MTCGWRGGDVAQDVIMSEQDCQTFDGIIVNPIMEGGDILEPLRGRIVGRIAQEDIYDPLTGDQLVVTWQPIDQDGLDGVRPSLFGF